MTRRWPVAVLTALLSSTAGCGTGTQPDGRTDDTATARPAQAPVVPSTQTPPSLQHLPSRAATVWAVGDGADGGDGALALARMIRRGDPDLFLYLGDVYESGTPREFAEHYVPLYGALARRTAPTPGNHEYPQRAVGYGPYWRNVMGAAVPDDYRVRIAGWDVLAVDSEAPHGPGSPQVAWLRREVSTGGTCRIVFWHRPRFSAGLHGDAPDMAPVWNTLRRHATFVLNGHDHTSQRLRPVDGVTEVVAGGGGHRPYPLNTADPRLAYASTGQPAALRLRLTPGRARLSFVRRDGTVLDRHTVGCRSQ